MISPPVGLSKQLERDVIIARIVPCVRDLCQDSSQHVRAALANQITGLAPLLGKEATTEQLLPLFLHMLKDEFPEVRLNIISKLEQVNEGAYFHFSNIVSILKICMPKSHRYPIPRRKPPPRYYRTRRRQVVACQTSHHRIHTPPRHSTRQALFRRTARQPLHVLARRYCIQYSRGGYC